MFLKKSKKKNDELEIDLSVFEDRVLELISKFQHISATRLSAMENKIEQMNKVLREANEMYFKLSAILSDTAKVLSDVERKKEEKADDKQQLNHLNKDTQSKKNVQDKEEKDESPEKKKLKEDSIITKEDDHFTFEEEFINPPDLKNSSLEHKIMNLSSEGLEGIEIAKKLGIGKGEVDLVLGLFKRKYS